MDVIFPQIDYIMHADLQRMTYSQREYVNLMNQANNFINKTFETLLVRISREYDEASIIDILSMAKDILDEENSRCEDEIIFDDFVKNASLTSQSLKKIILSPSTKLIKINKNVLANKVTHFDSRTMTWLSRRPGATIEEKIAPKNIIPTKVTYFTPDTVENRHTMYLFNILYDYLYEKVYPLDHERKCETCPYKDKKCYELYDKLKTILFLKHNVNSSELKNVPKQKQLRQNNKLLSDKEYKQIWDAVRDIDYYEQNVKQTWENLKQRYQFLSFLFISSKISSIKGIRVFDSISKLIIKDGLINLINEKGESNIIHFYSIDDDQKIELGLKDEKLHVKISKYNSSNDVRYTKEVIIEDSYDLANIFSPFEKIIEQEKNLETLTTEVEALRANIKTRNNNFEDYKKAYTQFCNCLTKQINKEVYNEQEKQKEQDRK